MYKLDKKNEEEHQKIMHQKMLQQQQMMQQQKQPTPMPAQNRENFSIPKPKDHKLMYLVVLVVLLILAFFGFMMWKEHNKKSGTKAGFKFY
jgi:hypothetical protein